MTDISRREILKKAAVAGAVSLVAGPKAAQADASTAEYRWDIVNIIPCPRAGGEASAAAQDGSRITVTGSGTFRDSPGRPQEVTGGGTWAIVGPGGSASGTYEVTRFVSFELAPGTLPLPCDEIGDLADTRAGLLTVSIEYDDGTEGVLVVSCHLAGTPDSVMEGITASKSFVYFWNHDNPVPGVEGNRTLFHILR